MLKNLPIELCNVIYSFDNTTKENYDIVLNNIKLRPKFLSHQEIWNDINSYKYRYMFIYKNDLKTIESKNKISYLNLLQIIAPNLFNITSKGIGKYDILSTRIYEN
jgi:hypothetical protein